MASYAYLAESESISAQQYLTLNQMVFHTMTRSDYSSSKSGTVEELNFWPVIIARNSDRFAIC